MTKKKQVKTRSHLAPKSKKGENRELNGLPPQKPEEICLYKTDTEALAELPGAVDYRDGLVKLKAKFLSEIYEWSNRFGIDATTRVYFELKPEG